MTAPGGMGATVSGDVTTTRGEQRAGFMYVLFLFLFLLLNLHYFCITTRGKQLQEMKQSEHQAGKVGSRESSEGQINGEHNNRPPTGHSLPIYGLSFTLLLHVPLHMAPVMSEEGHNVISRMRISCGGEVQVLVKGECCLASPVHHGCLCTIVLTVRFYF